MAASHQLKEKAMHYSIMIHETEAGFAARHDPAQADAYWSGTMAYLQALKEAGIFVAGAGLQPPASATTIRFSDGRPQVQDGPFADTKEQLGGFFIISVPDLDQALDWAARFPQRPGVVVEVRPNLAHD
ncbi:YciI family protein [Massilia sp. TS11]|uniref:YciI family protein n=1 Tax=Massilia sp. TS11 TaxID=2908003 RepID=UPI001EDB131E|nr:YciI family protein [Massilia sp. TS11]MCG2584929.1 YciI family protein [Massilia sp. TS11]